MLGSTALPQLEDGEGKPWFVHIIFVFSMKSIRTNVFLKGVSLRGEDSRQAQCFTA